MNNAFGKKKSIEKERKIKNVKKNKIKQKNEFFPN